MATRKLDGSIKFYVILVVIALFLNAFGSILMGYEQREANKGFFIPVPTSQEMHPSQNQPKSPAERMF